MDEIAKKAPEKLAMLHIDKHKVERRFTFNDMKRASNQCANYFKSLGIKKGDRVMLVLKRHYQFWYRDTGAAQIRSDCYSRNKSACKSTISTTALTRRGSSAVICTADGDVAHQVEFGERPRAPPLKPKYWWAASARAGIISMRNSRFSRRTSTVPRIPPAATT